MESSDQARLAGNDTGALAGVGGIAVPGAAPLGVGQLIFFGVVGGVTGAFGFEQVAAA
jgi:hypothetical protein